MTHLLFSIFMASALFSLIQALQSASTVIPQCAKDCMFQASSESSCTTTDLTCVCKDPTYASVFDKCETKNCNAADQSVTKVYALSVCGAYKPINSTASASGPMVSRTATPIGGGTMNYNSTTMHNGILMATPVPYTGGSGVVKGCGAVVLAGLLVGVMAVAQ